MFQSVKPSSSYKPHPALIDIGPTIYLSLALIIVFFFLVEPLLFTGPHSHGFYFASPMLQNLCVLLEVLLPSIAIILLLRGPRTICSVFALCWLIPSNLIFLAAFLLVILSANGRLDQLSINQFGTSITIRKPLGNVIVGMSSAPILNKLNDKGEGLQFTRLWIERPVFSGLLREYKILSAEETLSAKFLVQEKGRKIIYSFRGFFGQPGEAWFCNVNWNSAPD